MELILIAVLALIIGGGGVFLFNRGKQTHTSEITRASVILEKVKPVCKMVCIEGSFSEILEHRENTKTFFRLIPKEKKSIAIVEGKALVGFDMQKVAWEADEASQTLRIKSFPAPEIIGIDHTVRYYDKKSSMLERFSMDDDNKVFALAKSMLHEKVAESSLPEQARQQAINSLAVIALMCEQMGWKLEYSQDQLALTAAKPPAIEAD